MGEFTRALDGILQFLRLLFSFQVKPLQTTENRHQKRI